MENSGSLSRDEAQEQALLALRKIRFGQTGYYFVSRYDGTVIGLGPKPQLEGKNLNDVTDSDGVYFVRDLIAAARSGGGFISYRFAKPGADKPSPKLAYATGFDPWNWMIGNRSLCGRCG